MTTAPNGPHSQPGEPEYAGMPTWVKWFLIAAAVVALVVVVALLIGGDHGPGRHMPSGHAPHTDTAGLQSAP